nr:tetratricopeptide repeat protein [Paraburkholderia sp. DHOC27]
MIAPTLQSSTEAAHALKADALNIAATCSLRLNRVADAENYWRQCIETQPDFAPAYDGLGMLYKSLKRLPEAVTVYRTLQTLRPGMAEVHNNLGTLLHDLRRLPDAEAAYRQALALRPDYAQAYFNLGLVLHDLRRLHDAETAYRAALAAHPDYAEAHNNLGNVLKEQGRLAEADAAYRQALLIKPHYPAALNNLGTLLEASNRLTEAELAFRLAVTVQSDYVEAHANLGALLVKLKRLPEAETALRQAISHRPGFGEAYYSLGNVLHAQGRLPEAEAAYRQAIALRPDLAEAHHNLGVMLAALDRLREAVACVQQALRLRAGYAEAHYNLGNILKRLDRLPEAEAAFRSALALRPDYADAHFYLATLLLATGQFAEGWQRYESRYEHPGFAHHNSRTLLHCPQWQGEPLTGRSLLVWQEDGLGDMIQFSRYLALLKARGAATITLACAPVLRKLMTGVDGVDRIVDPHTALSQAAQYDCWTSLMSAPWHARTTLATIPAATRFVLDPGSVERWRARLDTLPAGRKIGLVWKGNPQHHNDAHRSLPSLATLASLWTLPEVNFVSLQKGPAESEAHDAPASLPLLHLGSDVQDLADSAAIISQLDLVVCVDTSVAHLAASLRRPCWILLPATAVDWRWLHGRDDSPWYPDTVRLFRQAAGEPWTAVVERVRRAYIEQFV